MFIRDHQDLVTKLSQIRENKKVVFTNGCFDILHIGHVQYLKEARALGDILVVGLNSDSSVQKLKGLGRPVQKEEDRGQILAALESVTLTTLFSEETPLSLIEKIEPNVLVKGGDWPIEDIVGGSFVLSRGGTVRSLGFVDGRSTSEVIRKINKNS